MSLFRFLRWSENNRKAFRVLDYILGAGAIGYGFWQDSALSIVIGIICILAAFFNLSEKVNLFLPRIVQPRKRDDV